MAENYLSAEVSIAFCWDGHAEGFNLCVRESLDVIDTQAVFRDAGESRGIEPQDIDTAII